MAETQDEQIRRQFLEEAQEYLDTIEAVMLELSTHPTDERIDAALRAAHSIKGGAAMMGFTTLSDLAHNYEDSFKVIRAKRKTLVIDPALEQLLLSGVDCMRQVTVFNRQSATIDQQWVTEQALPIFHALKEQLGEAPAQTIALDDPDADVGDMALLLFETEVDSRLSELEALLSSPDRANLSEAITATALELGGLGEMLELGAFASLCTSVSQQVVQAPEHIDRIAQAAVRAWRQSQALILVGHHDLLPHELGSMTTPNSLSAAPVTLDRLIHEDGGTQAPLLSPDLSPSSLATTLGDDLATLATTMEFESIALDSSRLDTDDLLADWNHVDQILTGRSRQPFPEQVTAKDRPLQEAPTSPVSAPVPTRTSPKPVTVQTTPEMADSTVRVPVHQLSQLTDLFSELTVERNGLRLTLDRMRGLVNLLTSRVRGLEQVNTQLRTAYDRNTPQANSQSNGLGATPKPAFNVDSPEAMSSEDSFDTLEMDRYSELHLLSQGVMEAIVQLQEVTSDVGLNLEESDQLIRDLNRTARQMQAGLTQMRMRPLSDIVGRFPRALRELSQRHNKPVNLKVYGGTTLIDRTILEALGDPLMHLLRNCFDHGIEPLDQRQRAGKPSQGTIEIRAAYRGNRTIITISDDGGGINLDKIRAKAESMGLDAEVLATASDQEVLDLIFMPGFSTADQVTALSGRGVGMDVVRTNLQEVRGDIRVDTQLGSGTTFTISVPFTLSVVRVLLVESAGMMLAVPKDVIEELILLDPKQIVPAAEGDMLNWDDMLLPLIYLDRWFQFHGSRRTFDIEDTPIISAPTVLLTSQGQNLVGIVIDRCWSEQEVAIRQVASALPLPTGFAGCAILGDGRVIPLVDMTTLLPSSVAAQRKSTTPITGQPIRHSQIGASRPKPVDTVLVVDDSVNVRRYLALALEKAGYRVEQAKDGQDALDKLIRGLYVNAIICDIEMPRLDGFGFLARLKADPRLNTLPVAMLTSRIGDKHRQLGMRLGAAAYFSKPYREQDLLETLQDLIQR